MIGGRTDHPLAEARRAYPEREVEAPPEVLVRDHVRQLHQLLFVEVIEVLL